MKIKVEGSHHVFLNEKLVASTERNLIPIINNLTGIILYNLDMRYRFLVVPANYDRYGDRIEIIKKIVREEIGEIND